MNYAHAILGTLSLCGALTGCFRSIKTGYEVSQHAIFVGENGQGLRALDQAEAKARKRPALGELSEDSLRASIGRIMEGIRKSPFDTVTLFIHGGLVSHKGGYEKAVRLGPALEKDGHFPLFVIWEGGWGPTLVDHLKSVRQGQEWSRFAGYASSPFVIVGDVAKGFGRAPLGAIQQLGDYCARMKGLFADSAQKAIGAHECGFVTEKVDELRKEGIADALERVNDPLGLGLGEYHGDVGSAVKRTAIGLITAAPKIVVTGPLIDGFGGGTWNNLLRRTQTMFHRREEMTISPAGGTGYLPPKGAVSILLDSLRRVLTECETGGGKCRRMVLAGHSMGAIAAATILRQEPTLPIDRIYFMAAAASVAEVEASVIPFLQDSAHATTRFYNGMLHPRVESGEWQIKFLDLVPRGTLLEWIDDALGNANTPIERTAGKWVNMAAMSYIFPTEIRSRVVLKGFGYRDPRETGYRFDGLSSHGSFSDPGFQFWRDSTWLLRGNSNRRVVGGT